jgi:hypothetical protein
MISFLAVLMLSFITLYLGTFLADCFEQRRCTACGEVASDRTDQLSKR